MLADLLFHIGLKNRKMDSQTKKKEKSRMEFVFFLLVLFFKDLGELKIH